MAHHVFKILININDNVENIIVKHYVDLIYPCFSQFQEKLFCRYPSLKEIPYKMYWIDGDNDKITIYNEEDFRFYLDSKFGKIHIVAKSSADKDKDNIFVPTTHVESEAEAVKSVKFATSATEPTEESDKQKAGPSKAAKSVYHEGVICDGCDKGLFGFRYKCLQCYDFDLCMTCEGKQLHSHHRMIRIPDPLTNIKLNRHFFKSMRCGRGKDSRDKDGRDTSPETDEKHAGHRHRGCGRKTGRHGPHLYDIINNLVDGFVVQGGTQQYKPPQQEGTAQQQPQPQPEQEQSQKEPEKQPEKEPSEPKPQREKTAPKTNANCAFNVFTIPTNGQERVNYPKMAADYSNITRNILTNLSHHITNLIDPYVVVPESNENTENKSTNNEKMDVDNENVQTKSNESNNQEAATKESYKNKVYCDDSIRVRPIEKEPTIEDDPEEINVTVNVMTPPREHSPVLPKGWTIVDADGSVHDQQNKQSSNGNGAIPKESGEVTVTVSSSSSSSSSTSSTSSSSPPPANTQGNEKVELPNYRLMARELEEFMSNESTENSAGGAAGGEAANTNVTSSVKAALRQNVTAQMHPNKKINDSLLTMIAMGFSNDGDWLTKLLEQVDGNIPQALDLLQPNK